jgi:hypothetical protein
VQNLTTTTWRLTNSLMKNMRTLKTTLLLCWKEKVDMGRLTCYSIGWSTTNLLLERYIYLFNHDGRTAKTSLSLIVHLVTTTSKPVTFTLFITSWLNWGRSWIWVRRWRFWRRSWGSISLIGWTFLWRK